MSFHPSECKCQMCEAQKQHHNIQQQINYANIQAQIRAQTPGYTQDNNLTIRCNFCSNLLSHKFSQFGAVCEECENKLKQGKHWTQRCAHQPQDIPRYTEEQLKRIEEKLDLVLEAQGIGLCEGCQKMKKLQEMRLCGDPFHQQLFYIDRNSSNGIQYKCCADCADHNWYPGKKE